MSWREDMFNARFRDVPFTVEKVDSAVGRRVVLHEFPGRDKPFPEDNGKRPREFVVTGIVVGDDYMKQRDALVAAFETKGPGELVHPYWGPVSVVVKTEAQFTETLEDGGSAQFVVTFVEAGELPEWEPDIEPLPPALAAATSISEAFAAAVAFADQVAATYNDGVARINDATDAMRKALVKAQRAVDTLSDVVDTITAIENGVSALLALPGQLAAAVVGVYTSLCEAVADIEASVSNALDDLGLGSDTKTLEQKRPTASGLLSAAARIDLLGAILTDVSTFGDDWPTVAETTPSRTQLNTNRRALIRLMKTSAAIGVVRGVASPGMSFDDREQAMGLRDTVSAFVDTLLLDDELDDTTFAALRDMQVLLNAYLSKLAGTLPELVDYTPPGVVPSLALAQQLYQDPTREAEILARNPSIRHPGFVRGGDVLKVSDV